jgi:hypothetical protein
MNIPLARVPLALDLVYSSVPFEKNPIALKLFDEGVDKLTILKAFACDGLEILF